MKVLTIGWISIFLIIIIMNIYVWNRYWMIPFETSKVFKTNIYLVIHLSLTILSLYYFYLFFTGKTESKKASILSKVAGFYLTFLHYSVIMYLIHDLVKFSSKFINYSESFRAFSHRLFFGGFVIFFIAFLISIYSLINAKNIQITNYEINLEKKESSLEKLDIVYISDAHIGVSITRDNISSLVEEINKLNPDILFLGGDFFDEGTKNESKSYFVEQINNVRTKYGIFYVEGNHEYKSGNCKIEEELSFFRKQNIIVLQDEFYETDDFIIIGRKDRYGNNKKLEEIIDDKILNKPVILLDHRPGFKESSEIKDIDIQLSGHTHNGQFFPLNIFDILFSKVKKEYNYGYKKINKLQLIVSSGIGNWGIPSRIGSKREIVNIRVNFIKEDVVEI